MKEKNRTKKYIFFACITLIIIILGIIIVIQKDTYAEETNAKENNVKISNAKQIDIYEIIKNNAGEEQEKTIETKEEVLEFLTQYKVNKDLPKGTIQVIQQGREGLQKITVKKTFEEGQLIKEEQIGAQVTKASVNKIVEIGGANYTSSYKVKVGDSVYITADRIAITAEADSNSRKITTLHRNEELRVLEIQKDWYKISSGSITGWIKTENTTYRNPNAVEEQQQENQLSKQQLMAGLDFNMALNKPSGLSLEQFKKALTDGKDKNKIFEQNAEYFYYVEKQYNINGMFIAAIGIHESAWGTSKIARDKNNLFGYGAYDSNPYNGAYTFETYSESIDLMARVLVKYYLNPAGTKIYNDEVAKGTYYNGPTFSGVNKKYATDKNWANAVFNHMKYLYEKL